LETNSHFSEEFGSDVLIIGGAEDKLNERHILRRFVELSGGKDASILIVPVPSDFPVVTATLYKSIFENLEIKKVAVLDATTRRELLNIDAKSVLDGITGVFLTGGDQLRLSAIL
jgi:cyanophycinase